MSGSSRLTIVDIVQRFSRTVCYYSYTLLFSNALLVDVMGYRIATLSRRYFHDINFRELNNNNEAHPSVASSQFFLCKWFIFSPAKSVTRENNSLYIS